MNPSTHHDPPRSAPLNGTLYFHATDILRSLHVSVRTNGFPNVPQWLKHVAPEDKALVRFPGGSASAWGVTSRGISDLSFGVMKARQRSWPKAGSRLRRQAREVPASPVAGLRWKAATDLLRVIWRHLASRGRAS